MRKLIAAWPESRLSKKDYCEQAGIHLHSFYYWQKKVNQETDHPGFVPVEVNADAPLLDQPLEIVYPNGVVLRFQSSPGLEQIQSLVMLGL